MGFWQPNENHKLAAGIEVEHRALGRSSPGYPNSPIARPDRKYFTDTYAALGEYQWHFSDAWTAFLGTRFDNHSYTDMMFSPRAALVCAPNDKDTYKFIYNRSVRRSDENDLRMKYEDSGDSSPDELDTWEFRFERQHSKKFWFAFSGYYSDLNAVSWDKDIASVQPVGEYQFYGLEIEGAYRTDKTRVTFSHNYTQLINFKLGTGETNSQNISAEPYGYGNDLLNWSDHTTKFTGEYDFDPKWTVSSSLRLLWGYPGAEDGADYNRDVLGDDESKMPLSDGNDKAFGARAYVNLGLEYRQNENTTWRLDAYNVLGWIDKDINKRNYFWRSGMYRDEAAAFAVTVRHTF